MVAISKEPVVGFFIVRIVLLLKRFLFLSRQGVEAVGEGIAIFF